MKEEKAEFELLLSCMNQRDFSIVEQLGIRSNALIVNQYQSNGNQECLPYLEVKEMAGFCCKKYNLQGKGVSKSRNFAIQNSQAEICLFADDDEKFCAQYREIVVKNFIKHPDADVMIFHIKNRPKRVRNTYHRVYFPEILKVSSWQIAFRRKKIIEKKILFDEDMGAGTGNGAEEEIKFLLDCLKKKLKIFNVPIAIAAIQENSHSTWFYGYNEEFFENRGMTTRYLFGKIAALCYGAYYIITKRKLYQNDISVRQAWKALRRGIKKNRLMKRKQMKREIREKK